MLLRASLCNEFHLLFSLVKSRCLYPVFLVNKVVNLKKQLQQKEQALIEKEKKVINVYVSVLPYFVIGHIIS